MKSYVYVHLRVVINVELILKTELQTILESLDLVF